MTVYSATPVSSYIARGFSEAAIARDKKNERIPFISTVANLVILKEKLTQHFNRDTNLEEHSWEKYVHDKPGWRCSVLLIPIIGNIIVALYDAFQSHLEQPSTKAHFENNYEYMEKLKAYQNELTKLERNLGKAERQELIKKTDGLLQKVKNSWSEEHRKFVKNTPSYHKNSKEFLNPVLATNQLLGDLQDLRDTLSF
jgi:hypothetical protein